VEKVGSGATQKRAECLHTGGAVNWTSSRVGASAARDSAAISRDLETLRCWLVTGAEGAARGVWPRQRTRRVANTTSPSGIVVGQCAIRQLAIFFRAARAQ
jgi:hypothetical protein